MESDLLWLRSGPVFSYNLRYIVDLGLVEMAISTNPKPTIYRNLYKNMGSDVVPLVWSLYEVVWQDLKLKTQLNMESYNYLLYTVT